MKIGQLLPLPSHNQLFRRSHVKFFPSQGGCYLLATFDEEILYIGLSVNLRNRIEQHLDNPEKTLLTSNGRAVIVHYLESNEPERLERTWMNNAISIDGNLPILNKAYSPTSV